VNAVILHKEREVKSKEEGDEALYLSSTYSTLTKT